MSVMFQEEVSKLKLQIVELSEQNSSLERDKQRLAGLLTEERQSIQSLSGKLAQAEAELVDIRELLAEKTRQNERLSDAEQRASDETQRAKGLERERDDLAEAGAELQADLRKTKDDLAKVSARLVEADKQIEPLERLVMALNMQQNANTVIAAQLKLLDIGRPD